MNCRKSLLVALTLTTSMAFAQAAAPTAGSSAAPAQTPQAQAPQTANGTTGTMPQTGAPAATSSANNISGCLQRGFANFQVSDQASNSKYQIRGNGADLSKYENHVVQIKGIPDPSASKDGVVVFYAQQVQDSGQSCAPSGQAVAGNTPVTGQTASNGTAVNAAPASFGTATPEQNQSSGAIANNQTASAGAPPNTASAGQSAAAASTNADAARQSEVGAQSGTLGVDNKTPAQTTTGQQSGEMENKGTPQAGTPANAGTSASGTPQPSASGAATKALQGCLSSDGSSLSAGGKNYTLQGSTAEAKKLAGHQVEVNGFESMGVIDVKSVRDMGSSCSAK